MKTVSIIGKEIETYVEEEMEETPHSNYPNRLYSDESGVYCKRSR
jgi:hypothetical protein